MKNQVKCQSLVKTLQVAGVFTATKDCPILKEPRISAEQIGIYRENQTFVYDQKIIGKSEIWLSYLTKNQQRRYVLVVTQEEVFGVTGANKELKEGRCGNETVLDFVQDFGGISGGGVLGEAAYARVNDAAFERINQMHYTGQLLVRIPAGVYPIKRPHIGANVTFYGEPGTYFIGVVDGITDAQGCSESAFLYDGSLNVYWNRVTFRGIDNASNRKVHGLIHEVLNSSYIYFDHCVFDQVVSNVGHALDLRGSDHIYIQQSTFIGAGDDTTSLQSHGSRQEAIQTDYSSSKGVSAFENRQVFTHEPSHDIYVNHCRFLPIYVDSTLTQLQKYGPQPLGQHETVKSPSGNVINNIHFSHSLVLDTQPTTQHSGKGLGLIHFMAAERITIQQNQIERRLAPASPAIFTFFNDRKGSKVNNSGLRVLDNGLFNLNPGLDQASLGVNGEHLLKLAPAYAIFAVEGAHTMDNIHFDGNVILTAPNMQVVNSKHYDNTCANMRIKGTNALTWSNDNNRREVLPVGGTGNEQMHYPILQQIYGVLPNGTDVLIDEVQMPCNMPFNYKLKRYAEYHPAFSTIPIGYETPNNQIYVPYV